MPLQAQHTYALQELVSWQTSLDAFYQDEEAISIQLPPFTSRPNPTVTKDLVVASLYRPGYVVALDRFTGSLRWKIRLPSVGDSHVYAVGGYLYVLAVNRLACIDPDTGEMIWKFSPFYGSPVYAAGRLFFSDYRGLFYCLDASTGQVLWKVKPGRSGTTAIVHGGVVITGTMKNSLIAYDVDTGNEVWRCYLKDSWGEILLYEGAALVPASGWLYLVSCVDGAVLHRWVWGPGYSIDALTVAETRICVAVTDLRNLTRAPHGRTRLLCLDRDKTHWEWIYPGLPNVHLRWDDVRKLLYETTWDGLGIMDCDTGTRLACIMDSEHPEGLDSGAEFSPLATDEDGLYVLQGKMGRSVSLLALYHPS